LEAWDVLAGARPAAGASSSLTGRRSAGSTPPAARASDSASLALATVAAGTIHQYQRNLYLERLYRAGVRIEHHLELVEARAGRIRFRNLFAPELETDIVAGALVLALGRAPEDGLVPELGARGLRVEEAGDCRSPRSSRGDSRDCGAAPTG
jgi:hypothetical protein